MKQLSKQSLIGIVLIILTLLAITAVGFLGVGNRPQELQKRVENEKNTNNQKEISKSDLKNTGKDLLALHEEGIDMSDWKTYRNEEYGFEFELPKEYFLPENDKNVIRKQDTINILDPNKDIYTFNSKKGLEIVKEFGGLGDATDYWRVKVRVFDIPNNKREFIFDQWIRENYSTDIVKIGVLELSNEASANYVSWNSICDDYSVFFVEKKYVLEVNTCGSTFLADGKNDYFSTIVNSVSFSQ